MIDKKTDKPWFLYIIKMANNHLYTGITVDMHRRFNEHCGAKKGAKALKGKGPLTLMYCSEMGSRSDAQKAEYWVKQQTKATKTSLIKGQIELAFKHTKIKIELSSKQT